MFGGTIIHSHLGAKNIAGPSGHFYLLRVHLELNLFAPLIILTAWKKDSMFRPEMITRERNINVYDNLGKHLTFTFVVRIALFIQITIFLSNPHILFLVS